MQRKLRQLIVLIAGGSLSLGLLISNSAQSSEGHVQTAAERAQIEAAKAKLKPGDVTELQALKEAETLSHAKPILAADEKDPPDDIVIPSVVGEVHFPHSMHFEDQEIDCATCHHPVNAAPFKTPHNQYFANSKTNCKACHGGEPKAENQACSNCHLSAGHAEGQVHMIISAKLAAHKTCGACHEEAQAKGEAASKGCVKCHSGPKKGWK